MISRPAPERFDKRWALVFALWFLAPTSGAAAELPEGAEYRPGTRPSASEQPACSTRRPVCVHPASGLSGEPALAALEALDTAYERLILVSGLPRPLRDGGLGGDDRLDVYLVPTAEAEDLVRVEYDAFSGGGFERASGYCEIAELEGPLLARAATLCLAEVIALGLDPAETPHVRRAFATAMWWFVGAPTVLDLEAIDDFQAHPERAVARSSRDVGSEGAALFFDYLESTRGVAAPGVLSAALLGGSAQTSSSAETLRNEPDYVDVLRHTLANDRAQTVGLFRDFAASRVFVGSRDDGQHLPDVAWSGSFGLPRFDWVLPFSSLPRRVLLQRPIEPGGAALLWLTIDQAANDATLGFRAEWEAPVAFAWTLLRLDERGRELSRVDLPFQERASEAEGRVADLRGVAAVVVVGTYLDEVTLAHPFDPDVEPFEPHGATVYLARL